MLRSERDRALLRWVFGQLNYLDPEAVSSVLKPVAQALRGLADALEAIDLAAPPTDPWVALRPREPVAGIDVTGRTVIDAGRRGEIAALTHRRPATRAALRARTMGRIAARLAQGACEAS